MHPADIISAPDVKNIYEIPLNFEREKLAEKILEKFGLKRRLGDLGAWRRIVRIASDQQRPAVKIGVVGKYFATGKFTLADSYISVIESLRHAAWAAGRRIELTWLNAEAYEHNPASLRELDGYDGIVVPGGFGSRGVEGKIKAIEYVRTHQIPFFGLCYGMQLAAVEFARHVLKWSDAHTTEVNPKTSKPVIDLLPEQEALVKEHRLGGSMRLGNYRCRITPGTKTAAAYGQSTVIERHRHRYEFQNRYLDKFAGAGMTVAGKEVGRGLVEILELTDHPWFIGTQFHPELLSHPLQPHPLFRSFILAAERRRRQAAAPTKTKTARSGGRRRR